MNRRRDAFERVDRKLGRVWNRFWGGVLGLAGLGAVWTSLSDGIGALDQTWPFLAVGTLFLLVAAKMFRAKATLLETLDETPRR